MKQNTSHYSRRSRQEAKILSSQCQSNMIRAEAKMSKPSRFSNHPRHSEFNQAISGKTAKSTMLAIYVCSCSRSHPLGADRASMLPYASYHLFHTQHAQAGRAHTQGLSQGCQGLSLCQLHHQAQSNCQVYPCQVHQARSNLSFVPNFL
jgi:hypothetical protein